MKFAGLILSLIFSISVYANENQQVLVEFEWEEIPGATQYEVEVFDKSKKTIAKLKSPTSDFKVKLTPGVYSVRGRAYDYRQAFGEWSQLKEFPIPPKSLKKVNAPSKTLQVNENTYLASVSLSWPPSVGAHRYEVQIVDSSGKVIKSQSVTQAGFSASLRPGVYNYRITPVTVDNVVGETFESVEAITVQHRPVPEIENLELKSEAQVRSLNWSKKTELPTRLKLEYQKHYGTQWRPVANENLPSSSWSIPGTLAPGKYRASLWNQTSFGDISAVKVLEFVVKPKETELKF